MEEKEEEIVKIMIEPVNFEFSTPKDSKRSTDWE